MTQQVRQDSWEETMIHQVTRRTFLEAGVAAGVLATLGPGDRSTAVASEDGVGQGPKSPGSVVLNDDGHVFLYLSDDLHKADLRCYLESYCRPGGGRVADWVGG